MICFSEIMRVTRDSKNIRVEANKVLCQEHSTVQQNRLYERTAEVIVDAFLRLGLVYLGAEVKDLPHDFLARH